MTTLVTTSCGNSPISRLRGRYFSQRSFPRFGLCQRPSFIQSRICHSFLVETSLVVILGAMLILSPILFAFGQVVLWRDWKLLELEKRFGPLLV